jgi:hypothetical protein
MWERTYAGLDPRVRSVVQPLKFTHLSDYPDREADSRLHRA